MAEKPIFIQKYQSPKITMPLKHCIYNPERHITRALSSKKEGMFNSFSIQTSNKSNKLIKQHSSEFNKSTLIQPIMRFKPRTDMERIVDSLVKNSPYDHTNSKYILNEQLNKIRILTPKGDIKETKDYSIDNNESKVENNKKYNCHRKSKRIDNSKAKEIYPDLYNKTYFKAIENYSLFRNSFFIPKTKTIFSLYTNQTVKPTQQVKFNQFHSNLTTPSSKTSPFKKIKHSYSKSQNNIDTTMEFIHLLNKNAPPKIREQNLINSLDQIDTFTLTLDLYKNNENNGLTKMEKKEKLQQVHKLAFPHLYCKNENIIETDVSNEEKEYKRGNIPQYIYIEGVKYNKKDLENISNKVLEICNWRPKKKNK